MHNYIYIYNIHLRGRPPSGELLHCAELQDKLKWQVSSYQVQGLRGRAVESSFIIGHCKTAQGMFLFRLLFWNSMGMCSNLGVKS